MSRRSVNDGSSGVFIGPSDSDKEILNALGVLRAQRDAAVENERNIRAINNDLISENNKLKQVIRELQDRIDEFIWGEQGFNV